MFKLLLIIAFISASNQERKVFKGGDGKARVGQFPFHLNLKYSSITHYSNGSLLHTRNCGASIISKKWAITAAHCVMKEHKFRDKHTQEIIRFFTGPLPVDNFMLEAGSVYFNNSGIQIRIKEIVKHPKFDQGGYANYDIALLRFKEAFKKFPKNVGKIALPNEDHRIGLNSKATAIGSGNIDYNTETHQLYYVNLVIKDNEICELKGLHVSDNIICTKTKNQNVCKGDSGGSLVQKGKLIGILSGGTSDCNGEFPNAFTNVAKMRSFIAEETGL